MFVELILFDALEDRTMKDRGATHELRIFVAMPGTSMGAKNRLTPEQVKDNLLIPIKEKLQEKLGRQVKLEIEKDKLRSGVIHESMFAEARDSDVYIADLTGANPNVYLELGVRWALRDYVTVLIAQGTEDLKFNVHANRVIPYNAGILVKARDNIVETICSGLNSKTCDSPVRLNSRFVEIPKTSLEDLEAKIEQLKALRGKDLLIAAVATKTPRDRLDILKQAVDANPALSEAWLELGKTHRELGEYPDAVDALQTAQRLSPRDAAPFRELGVAYSKQGNSPLAANSLREAVRIDPNDIEAWSNLGGALRRVGMTNPANPDRSSLNEARDSYAKAHLLNKFDLYSGLNVARLELLLSRWEPELLERAKEGFRKQLYLCRHAVQDNPKDYWRQFDLADALLFSGEYKEAHEVFGRAIKLIPEGAQQDTLSSVLGPLHSYVDAGVIQGDLLTEVKKAVDELEAAKR
ncbi:MAG TPA: tetratricopeptide repeat protein [Thermoanaerobaculia bacterium]